MPEERGSIVSKAEAMKKAGFHPVMIVVITVLSTPGIWQQFFDDTDEQALRAVEKAYPLLAKESKDNTEARKRQAEINQQLLVEFKVLKAMIALRHGRGFGEMMPELMSDDPLGGGGLGGMGIGLGEGATLMAPEALFPAAGDGDADDELEGAGEPSEASDEGYEEPPPPPPAPAPPRPKAKGSLEDLIEQQQQAPIRDDLPDLGELLGKK